MIDNALSTAILFIIAAVCAMFVISDKLITAYRNLKIQLRIL